MTLRALDIMTSLSQILVHCVGQPLSFRRVCKYVLYCASLTRADFFLFFIFLRGGGGMKLHACITHPTLLKKNINLEPPPYGKVIKLFVIPAFPPTSWNSLPHGHSHFWTTVRILHVPRSPFLDLPLLPMLASKYFLQLTNIQYNLLWVYKLPKSCVVIFY